MRLGDVLAQHQAPLQGILGDAEPGQGGQRRHAVGRGLRVGQRQVLEVGFLQHLAVAVDVAFAGRPQHQGADGIGEAAAGQRSPLALELGWGGVVGGEKDLEGRTVVDLCVELAGGAEGEQGPVSGVLLELGGDGLHRRGEVGGHGYLDLASLGGRQRRQAKQQGGAAAEESISHDDDLAQSMAMMKRDTLISAVAPDGVRCYSGLPTRLGDCPGCDSFASAMWFCI
ncbi:hypothetical protein D3C78_1200040 [compost metagenome]